MSVQDDRTQPPKSAAQIRGARLVFVGFALLFWFVFALWIYADWPDSVHTQHEVELAFGLVLVVGLTLIGIAYAVVDPSRPGKRWSRGVRNLGFVGVLIGAPVVRGASWEIFAAAALAAAFVACTIGVGISFLLVSTEETARRQRTESE